jgi:Lon protease-like protein
VLHRLPLFPLGTVLFPGLVLPLHVFEERYRILVREMLELPEEERRFGVVAIRQGREVGAHGVHALYDVGCVAHLRRADPYADGRFDLVSTGTARFRLADLDQQGPYLTAEVEVLPDDMGAAVEAPLLDWAVRTAFTRYLTALAAAGGEPIEVPELPDSPLVLSYLVAATMSLDLGERQQLLAALDGSARLRAELGLLRREATLLQHLSAAPASELTRAPVSPN